jgi:hypothetical protein
MSSHVCLLSVMCLRVHCPAPLCPCVRCSHPQSVLEEYINSQIFMHCRAVEKLSAVAQLIASINPDEEAAVRPRPVLGLRPLPPPPLPPPPTLPASAVAAPAPSTPSFMAALVGHLIQAPNACVLCIPPHTHPQSVPCGLAWAGVRPGPQRSTGQCHPRPSDCRWHARGHHYAIPVPRQAAPGFHFPRGPGGGAHAG